MDMQMFLALQVCRDAAKAANCTSSDGARSSYRGVWRQTDSQVPQLMNNFRRTEAERY